MEVIIDPYAGFCFGVKRAVEAAEKAVASGVPVYSLGDLVHNEHEVRRLENEGVIPVSKDQYLTMEHCHVVIRAHGEPSDTYHHAKDHDITLVDATCPVVKKLRERVKASAAEMQKLGGKVVIVGKKDHPEIQGILGQTSGPVIVAGSESEVEKLDLNGPVRVFSQTTMDVAIFGRIIEKIKEKAAGEVLSYNTVCRQISGRVPVLERFANENDVVVFVSSPSSSNGRYLFSVIESANKKAFMVNSVDEIRKEWFRAVKRVGVSGAASTSVRKLEEIARYIEKI